MAVILLSCLLLFEIIFLVWSISEHSRLATEKSIGRIAVCLLFILLLITGVLVWGFRYYAIAIVLGVQAIWGIVVLVRKPKKPFFRKKAIGAFICSILLFITSLLPAFLFPQYKPISTTGSHTVATAEYTWTDPNRVEPFTDTGENRFVNVSFWYPEEAGQYPLVVFSHGAFGVAISNESTFQNLASNGYVVVSIAHPYHSFFSLDERKNVVLVNTDFMNSVYTVNQMEDGKEKLAITQQWMDVRLGDIHFVLDKITGLVKSNPEDALLGKVDVNKIGLIGHSMGGAACAQIARERNDISAVIVLDGTMLGEVVGFENGAEVLNESPYPVPLFNIYRQAHYESALPYGKLYANFHAAAHAVSSYETIFKNAGHMSFTDLPLFSPILAGMLEDSTNTPSTADARYVIETMNKLVLEFYDFTLKGAKQPQFEKEY